ncbi:MAG TPA: hypothetical protein VI524_00625, partial [Anaerolineales bacterium]|nr:hypothetical protein [Anaerolineales bacterium]
MIRVLLNVPSPALRAGLRALLSADKTLRVVNDSLDEDDLQSEADVIITSASRASFSNDGVDLVASTATLFLSDDQPNVRALTRSLRVWGILPTDASAEELTAAVHALSQGLIVGTSTLLFESESEPLSHGPLT